MSEVARETDYAAEMRLPEGRTCGDCAHTRRCFAFGFSAPGCTSCDFWPSRFRLPAVDEAAPRAPFPGDGHG